jgi:ferrous iron transport protein B
MLFVFQAIFSFSKIPMEFIESTFDQLKGLVQLNLPDTWWASLLTDGILSGMSGILIFVPQIAILFLLLSILEELGYMARAVYMFDHVMQRFGLNGRSIVALISGGACAIPAIMATRTIENQKERLITILVTPFISCSARLPVYSVLVGFVVPPIVVGGIFSAQALVFMALYLIGIFTALGSAYLLKKIIKLNDYSTLMIELPEYRKPSIKNMLLNLREKVASFVFGAGKMIMIISVILWVLANFAPGDLKETTSAQATQYAQNQQLDEQETADLIAAKQIEVSYAGQLGKFIEPAIRPLGFDWKIGIALITSFAAREVFVGTMSTIYSIGSADGDNTTIREKMAKEINPNTGKPMFTVPVALSLLLFYVFALQCMSTIAIVKRETQSWKYALFQFLFMGGLAYLSSFLVYQLLS